MLRDRGYSLPQLLVAVSTHATPAGRMMAMATIRQAAATDQANLAQAVVGAGGVVQRHFWAISALAVEIPPAAVPLLAALPRVRRMVPVRDYPTGDALPCLGVPQPSARSLPLPVALSTDSLNHNVGDAWQILQGGSPPVPYKGTGARVAVFDTGIDRDVDGTSAQADPHPAFFLAGTATSRIDAHLQSIGVPNYADVNMLAVQSVPGVFGYRYGQHSPQAGHGTAMASIIAGTSYSIANPSAVWAAYGHAPDARIVDVACSTAPQGIANQWQFNDPEVIAGVENLRAFIAVNRPSGQSSAYVHVVNMSIGGDPNPSGPLNMVLDKLAREEDILVIASAGNTPDATFTSPGFYHGLAVGAVHARTPSNLAFVPMLQTTTGPLFGDLDRYYPDVCATGAGSGFAYPSDWPSGAGAGQASCLLMAGIDLADASSRVAPAPLLSNNVSPNRNGNGTSEACAQVSGAAALYRGYRASRGTPASAEETRAVLLLNVLGTYTAAGGTTADPALSHSYLGRNRLGVGYVRDDLVAEFAARLSAIRPLSQTVTLGGAVTSATLSYGGLQSGKRYGVVACWRRWVNYETDDNTEWNLPNVDLDVLLGGAIIARSETRANSYERVVFLMPSGSGSVTLRLRLLNEPEPGSQGQPLPQNLSVQVVAREFADDIDPQTAVLDPVHAASGLIALASAGTGCVQTSADWTVDRIVPLSYEGALGSAAFTTANSPPSAPTSPPPPTYFHSPGYENGCDLGRGRLAVCQPASANPYQQNTVAFSISSAQMGGAMTISGIAFRTWDPLSTLTNLTVDVTVGEAPYPNQNGVGTLTSSVTTLGAVLHRLGSARFARPDDFGVVVPLSAPFNYSGADAFHCLVRVSASSSAQFTVDGAADGGSASSGYTTTYWAYNAGPSGPNVLVSRPGEVPIIGLIAASVVAAREPHLQLYGEPWCGSGSVVPQCTWRLSNAMPGSVWTVFVGDWAATPTSLPPCLSWLSDALLLGTQMTDGAGMAWGTLDMLPGLLHREFGLQAATVIGAPGGNANQLLLSNAVRVTVGGGL